MSDEVFFIGGDFLTVGDGFNLLLAQLNLGLRLADQWQNRRAGVATDNRDLELPRVVSKDVGHKLRSSDHIQSCHTKQTLRVENAVLLEHLSGNGDSAVDRVGDDADKGCWAKLCDTSSKVRNDAGIGLEKVLKVSGNYQHVYLTRKAYHHESFQAF